MSDETRYFHHPGTADKSTALEIMSDAACTAAWQEIRRWPGYQQTPLYDWSALAQKLGLRKVYYKDESSRFDIGSFKALGGAYAVRKLAAEHFGIPLDELKRNRLPPQHDFCVITATDGNHGRSVAYGARSLNIPCLIYLHERVSAYRQRYIEQLGATVVRVVGNYDDSVRRAAQDAEEHGWHVVSDTAYPGYTDIPRDVMHGYSVMCREIGEQLTTPPSHVLICGGCGGLAGAVIGYLGKIWLKTRWIIIEPSLAPSLQLSARNDRPSRFDITEETLMAGLSCGEISIVAWNILKDFDVDYLHIGEDLVVPSMELIAAQGIEAGETSAATPAGLCAAMDDPALSASLGLDADATVLLFGTEGATDPETYQRLLGFTLDDLPQQRARLQAKHHAH